MRRPSPALVVAVLALVVAMSGTSYAVTQLPRNSVGATQLKRNAVTAQKIASNAVTGAKVEDGSLTAADFAAGTLLRGPKGDTGATGATGPKGDTGATGPSTSAAAKAVPDLPLRLTSADQSVISLGATPSVSSATTDVITVSVASNLAVAAGLTLRARLTGDDLDWVEVTCTLQYRAVPSGTWTDFEYGVPSVVTIEERYTAVVSPVALQAVPAGRYDVQALCRDTGGRGIIYADFVRGALTVVATGR